ncbi:MAG: hypothetical protein JNM07_05175 [Phycisphaerae bacterium]|nr:hypothetical protein [Phycisphaerae bacterium]
MSWVEPAPRRAPLASLVAALALLAGCSTYTYTEYQLEARDAVTLVPLPDAVVAVDPTSARHPVSLASIFGTDPPEGCAARTDSRGRAAIRLPDNHPSLVRVVARGHAPFESCVTGPWSGSELGVWVRRPPPDIPADGPPLEVRITR